MVRIKERWQIWTVSIPLRGGLMWNQFSLKFYVLECLSFDCGGMSQAPTLQMAAIALKSYIWAVWFFWQSYSVPLENRTYLLCRSLPIFKSLEEGGTRWDMPWNFIYHSKHSVYLLLFSMLCIWLLWWLANAYDFAKLKKDMSCKLMSYHIIL